MSHTIQHYRRRRAAIGRPDAPAAPTVSTRTTTQIVVTWAAVTGATAYLLERSVDSGATWAAVPSILPSTRSYTDSSLTASTAYAYRLSVTTAGGTSLPSAVLSTSTTAELSPPPTPTVAPTVDSFTSTQVVLTAPTVTGATSYSWQRSTSATTGFAVITGATGATLTDTGRTASTTYYYRVAGVNADGTGGYSPNATATTEAAAVVPATPATPTSSGISSASVILTTATVAGATSYVWQQSTSPTTGFTTLAGKTTREVSIAGLSASTTYYFRVAASSSAGTSSYSPNRSVLTTAAGTTTVTPVSARFVRRHAGFRVAPHENGATSVYKGSNAEEICRIAADMGLWYVRGMFPGAKGGGLDEWVTALKKYDLKWLMTLIPEAGDRPTDQTVEETKTKVRTIRDDPDLAGLCLGLEGINEPNHNKGNRPDGSMWPIPADWATTSYNHQAAIWDLVHPADGSVTTLSDVLVVGPSLQATFASNSYRGTGPWPGGARHYHQVVEAGCLNKMDIGGLHTYPNGTTPEQGADFRLENMRNAYGADYPVFVSEWGYSNAINSTQGNPVSPEVAGIYAPRGFLEYIIGFTGHDGPRDPLYMTWYEAMDNWNPGKTEREAWFGAIGTAQQVVTPTRTAAEAQAAAANSANFFMKPTAEALKWLLNPMKDPAGTAAYTTTPVTLSFSGAPTNMLWWCVANKAQSDAGTATVFMVRDAVYNAATVNVTVTDRVGARTPVAVGGEVVKVELR